MYALELVAATSLPDAEHEPLELPRIAITRGVGKAHFIDAEGGDGLGHGKHPVLGHGAFQGAAKSGGKADFKMRPLASRQALEILDTGPDFGEHTGVGPVHIFQRMGFTHGKGQGHLVGAMGDGVPDPPQIGRKHRHAKPFEPGGVAHDFAGIGQLRQQFAGNEGAHFHFPATRGVLRGDPGLLVRRGHGRRDILQAVPQAHLADKNVRLHESRGSLSMVLAK